MIQMLNQVVRLLLLIHEENLSIMASVFQKDVADNIAKEANGSVREILFGEEADTTARQPPEDEETSEEKLTCHKRSDNSSLLLSVARVGFGRFESCAG